MSTDKIAQREQIIRKWAQKILLKISEILPSHPNEADFCMDIDPLLDQFCDEIDVHPIRHHEYMLATDGQFADAYCEELLKSHNGN